jgi:transcription elongation factor Elf1
VPENIFVIVLRDIPLPDGGVIRQDEVGIIKPGAESVFFVRLWQDVALPPTDYQIIDVAQTGDTYPKKVCNMCHRLLPTTQFARNQNNVNRPVRRPSCQECRKTLEGKDPPPREKQRWVLAKPDKEPFECPICGKRTIAGVTSKLDLDHDHRTGKIRGWICDSCNTGIGRFKDNIELMERAKKYVE